MVKIASNEPIKVIIHERKPIDLAPWEDLRGQLQFIGRVILTRLYQAFLDEGKGMQRGPLHRPPSGMARPSALREVPARGQRDGLAVRGPGSDGLHTLARQANSGWGFRPKTVNNKGTLI
jgi:hypothetical protein